jgi:hypothetical protein
VKCTDVKMPPRRAHGGPISGGFTFDDKQAIPNLDDYIIPAEDDPFRVVWENAKCKVKIRHLTPNEMQQIRSNYKPQHRLLYS